MMKAGEEVPPQVPYCNDNDNDYNYDDDELTGNYEDNTDDYMDNHMVDEDNMDEIDDMDDMIGERTIETKQQQQQHCRYGVSSSWPLSAQQQVSSYYAGARTLRDVRYGEYWTSPRTGILSLYRHVTEIKQDLDFAIYHHHHYGVGVGVGSRGGDDAHTITSTTTKDDEYYLMVDYAEFIQQTGRAGLTRWPIVTVALLTVLVAVFLYELDHNGWSVEPFPDNPFLGPPTETLVALGAIYTPDIVTKDNNDDDDDNHPSFYRFLAATFLHGGLLQLVVHLPLVYTIGRALERAGPYQPHHNHHAHFYHRMVVLLVFCTTGLCANIATATIGEPFAVHAGPSGALCGWYGYCLVDGLLHLHLVTNYRPATILFGIVVELILLFLVGLLPFLDNTAHVFGFGSGALLGLILIPTRSLRQDPLDCFWHGNRSGLAAAILFCLVSSAMLYLFNAESVVDLPCRQCHRYLSCVLWPNSYCDPCHVATTTPDRTPGGYYLLHCPYEETVRSRQPIDNIIAACRESCDLY